MHKIPVKTMLENVNTSFPNRETTHFNFDNTFDFYTNGGLDEIDMWP